jgi:hypothetical protein
MEKIESIKLKGHGSFYLRDGWLEKAINNPNYFGEEYPTDKFGVGSAMVKSIKYYVYTMGIVEYKNSNEGYVLTKLGEIIKKYDKYLSDIFSLWILHYEFVKNLEEATTWNLYFNLFEYDELTKEQLEEKIINYLENNNSDLSISKRSLRDDINCIINSYSNYENKKNQTPEDNYHCPFNELELIEKVKVRNKEHYKKKSPEINSVNKYLILYALTDIISAKDDNKNNKTKINYERLIEDDNSICKLFNIKHNDLLYLLQELEKDKTINIDKSMGINMVYLEKDITKYEVLKKYYSEEGNYA